MPDWPEASKRGAGSGAVGFGQRDAGAVRAVPDTGLFAGTPFQAAEQAAGGQGYKGKPSGFFTAGGGASDRGGLRKAAGDGAYRASSFCLSADVV